LAHKTGLIAHSLRRNRMSHYEQLATKALGLAFILGPLLLTMGAAVYLLGIERSPDGTSSWVEGIFQAYAWPFMLPANLELARRLGRRAPRYALFCAVASLFIVFTLMPAMARLLQVDIINAGLDESIWRVGMQHAGWTPLVLGMALGLFSSTFLGIGFLWKGGLSRGAALLLLAAPILLVIGQGGDETIAWWQVNLFYPLACLTWLAALAPIGWRSLRDERRPAHAEARAFSA
jgi:hypothetical protein